MSLAIAGKTVTFAKIGNKPISFMRIDEDQVFSTAAPGVGVMYMAGIITDKLYTVDLTTGVATVVNTSSLGVLGQIAYEGTYIYYMQELLSGSVLQDQLWRLELSSGSARRIGSSRVFGISSWNRQSVRGSAITYDGSAMHWAGGPSGQKRYGTIDLGNGRVRLIGGSSAAGYGLSAGVTSIAFVGSTLYASSGSYLFTIDTATGLGTRVGSADNWGVSEVWMRGLAYNGVNLYGVGDSGQGLYTINTSTGVASRAGTATQFGVGERLGSLSWAAG